MRSNFCLKIEEEKAKENPASIVKSAKVLIPEVKETNIKSFSYISLVNVWDTPRIFNKVGKYKWYNHEDAQKKVFIEIGHRSDSFS